MLPPVQGFPAQYEYTARQVRIEIQAQTTFFGVQFRGKYATIYIICKAPQTIQKFLRRTWMQGLVNQSGYDEASRLTHCCDLLRNYSENTHHADDEKEAIHSLSTLFAKQAAMSYFAKYTCIQ